MTQYLISFDAHAMDHVPPEEMSAVGEAARAVSRDAGRAGVLVFTGLLEDAGGGTLVATDGTVTNGPRDLRGGATIVEVPTREEALEWAARIASACRCAQEVRQFIPGPDLDAMRRRA